VISSPVISDTLCLPRLCTWCTCGLYWEIYFA